MNDRRTIRKKKRKKGYLYILLSLLIIAIFWFFVILIDSICSNVIYGYYKGEAFIQHPFFREDFKKVMEVWNKLDKYDFYDVDIEENDYYLLLSDDLENPYIYELYYYDTETHVLYVLETS